jgi:hypothetical protein
VAHQFCSHAALDALLLLLLAALHPTLRLQYVDHTSQNKKLLLLLPLLLLQLPKCEAARCVHTHSQRMPQGNCRCRVQARPLLCPSNDTGKET